ncbi:MAG: hypothetical protein ACRD3H_04430 [Terriglobales bacterium]
MSKTGKCEHKKSNGERCRAKALTNDRFCFFHSPAKNQERRQARKAGGVSRSQKTTVLHPVTEDQRLQSPTDVCDLLGTTINQVRSGLLDSRIATTVGYLATALLRGMEHGHLDDRLSKIEAKLGIVDGTRKEIIPHAPTKSIGPN